MKFARTASPILIFAATAAWGQIPDVQIKMDARIAYRTIANSETNLRLYDTLGRQSLVGLQFQLEPGIRMYISERLEKIRHDGDPDTVDEYYLEEPGSWRVGKQVMPFGAGLIRESVLAARSDTSFFLHNIPVRAALFDSGTGRQQGGSTRIGTRRFGVSFADGDHLGISATSLTLIRRPEESPGVGSGYRQLIGLDASGSLAPFKITAEYVGLRDGLGALNNEDVLDLAATLSPDKYRSLTFGFTRAFQGGMSFMRLQASFLAYNYVSIEPIIRMRGDSFYDFGVSLRLKF